MDAIKKDEIEKLLPICEKVFKSRILSSFVVFGRRGSGQKEMVGRLLDRIFADQSLLIYVPKMTRKDIYRVEYLPADQNSANPYKAFVEIARLMERKRKVLSIVNRVFGILLALVGVSDLVDKFRDLTQEVKEYKDKEEKFHEKECKLFKQFTKEISKFSRKRPFIISIGNAQWLDRSSCQLLKYLLEKPNSFWGIIILEYSIDDNQAPQPVDSLLWDLIKDNKVKTVKARLLDSQYFSNYQKETFGKIIFDEEESDRIIELSEEKPSKLDELVESWKFHKLIYKQDGEWVKSRSLALKELKTTEEKLIEIYKVFMEDGRLSNKEEGAFNTQASSLGYPEDKIEIIRSLALFEVKNPRYKIIRRLRSGTIGDIYKGYDNEIHRNVFIEIDQRLGDALADDAESSGLRSTALLNTLEIRHAENFNYVVTEYSRGMTLGDLRSEYLFFDFDKTYAIAKNLVGAISLLHRKNFIHGNLRPDNIFVEEDGSVKVGGMGFIKSFKYDIGKGLHLGPKGPYSSPEHIKGESLSMLSDVFSIGTILYELFTGQLPFAGDGERQMGEAIVSGPIRESAYLESRPDLRAIIYKAIDKNEQVRPSSAESLNIALDHITHPAPTEGHNNKDNIPARGRILMKWAFLPMLLILAFFGGKRLIKIFFHVKYDARIIAINQLKYNEGVPVPPGSIEKFIERALMAGNPDKIVFRMTSAMKATIGGGTPENEIAGEVMPYLSKGLRISLTLRHRGKTKDEEFLSVGTNDLLSTTMEHILRFMNENAEGTILRPKDERPFVDFFTANWEACNHLLKAEQLWARIETEPAKGAFRDALEYDPSFSLARLELAEILVWSSKYAEATKEISQAKSDGYKLIPVDNLRLQALEAQIAGRRREQQTLLLQLTERYEGNIDFLYALAESYFHAVDIEAARQHYLTALTIDPRYAKAHNHLAFCLSWLGAHGDAEKHFKEYVTIDKTGNSYDSLATGYLFAGRYEDGIKAAETGLKIDPKLYSLYGILASNLFLKGSLQQAGDSWMKRMELDNEETTTNNGQFYYAVYALWKGDRNEAEKLLVQPKRFYSKPEYQNDTSESPNLPFWLDGVLAYLEGDESRLEKAIQFLNEKIKRFAINATNYAPIYKYFLHLTALNQFMRGDFAALRETITLGMRIQERFGYWSSPFNRSFILGEFADLLMRADNLDEAIRIADEALAYNPNNARIYIIKAKVAHKLSDPVRASEMLRKAAELLSDADPDHVLVKEIANMTK